MSHHIGETNKMISDTPRTDRVLKNCNGWHHVPIELARELERELAAAQERIKRLEEALDLVRPHCDSVHHSKKHQHQYGEPCPVVALIENAKEAKL